MKILRQALHQIRKGYNSVLILLRSLRKKRRSNSTQKILDNNNTNEVIVMGNGPSLNDINFSKISREKYVICCVNDYPVKSKDFERLKPEFLCLLDPAYYDFTIESEKQTKKKLLDILNRVDWDMKIIAPEGKRLDISNQKIKYAWINTNEVSKDIYLREKWWLFNNNFANPGMQNVVLGAIYYFLLANYKTIYLCGVDFSDFKSLYVDEDNRIFVDSEHSYGKTRYYFDEMPEYGFDKFHKILGAYQKMFNDACNLREYANKKGIEIINLSVNSYIDSFKKEKPRILE